MNKKLKKKLLKQVDSLMALASDNAASHYDSDALGVLPEDVSEVTPLHELIYEKLNSEAQHEYEGIMWGWQDCCVAIKKIIEEL